MCVCVCVEHKHTHRHFLTESKSYWLASRVMEREVGMDGSSANSMCTAEGMPMY